MKRFICLAISIAFVACDQQYDDVGPDDDHYDINLSNPVKLTSGEVDALKLLAGNNLLTPAEAIYLTGSFVEPAGHSQPEPGISIDIINQYDKPVLVASCHHLCQPEELLRIYEMEITHGSRKGFALATGDRRMPIVLAYAEEGSLSDTLTNRSLHTMLSYAVETAKEQYRELLQQSHTALTPTLEKIIRAHGNPSDLDNINRIKQIIEIYVPTVSKDKRRGSEINIVKEEAWQNGSGSCQMVYGYRLTETTITTTSANGTGVSGKLTQHYLLVNFGYEDRSDGYFLISDQEIPTIKNL